jgi:hypothetical protein
MPQELQKLRDELANYIAQGPDDKLNEHVKNCIERSFDACFEAMSAREQKLKAALESLEVIIDNQECEASVYTINDDMIGEMYSIIHIARAALKELSNGEG